MLKVSIWLLIQRSFRAGWMSGISERLTRDGSSSSPIKWKLLQLASALFLLWFLWCVLYWGTKIIDNVIFIVWDFSWYLPYFEMFWWIIVATDYWYFSLKHTETRVFCFWRIWWVSNTQFLLKWCRPNICNFYHKNNSLQYVHRGAVRFVGNSKQVLFVFHHSKLHLVEV